MVKNLKNCNIPDGKTEIVLGNFNLIFYLNFLIFI